MSGELLKAALERAVTHARAPGAAACVGVGQERLFLGAAGNRAVTPAKEPATVDTLYDVASLTKVVATTTAVMLLRDQGLIQLDQPVYRFIPLANLDKLTLRHLLTHTTGLPAWRPWYTELAGILPYVERIAVTAQDARPDTVRTYSDMGFILLGSIVERVAQEQFDFFCSKHIFEPLGMKDTVFKPSESLRLRCAPTEQSAPRGRLLRGEVHDDNAWALGGVAGHAGLFSTAEDLERFCRALLAGQILAPGTLEEMTRIGQIPYYPWQGLGWWLDPWTSGSIGFLPSRTAFGHTGFTGTSLWLDRANGAYVILLSNTCHPDQSKRDNAELRLRFHNAVASIQYPKTTNAHTGLDKLLRNQFEELRGKRIALLSNMAAVDQLGRPILDVLGLDKTLNIRYVYSPEHGFAGQAEAGEKVSSQGGPTPIISLYGERKQPSAAELKHVDLFVVDLPDIGARYYTYMATMKDCMAACAEQGTPMLILDRPNPLGGAILEGPVARQFSSPVCCAPIPIRHGMTLGELALFFQETFFARSRLQLDIATAENWWREFQFDACALPWAPPSPNIPDADTALMYIGTCLFEGLNLNEGRGTETPFLVCGAPWLRPAPILEEVNRDFFTGLAVKPVLYMPKSIPGKAVNPQYRDILCQGISFQITDRQAVRPLSAVLELISTIHRRHQELEWKSFFDTLAGGPWIREQIQAGAPVSGMLESIREELAAFELTRPKRYPALDERLKA